MFERSTLPLLVIFIVAFWVFFKSFMLTIFNDCKGVIRITGDIVNVFDSSPERVTFGLIEPDWYWAKFAVALIDSVAPYAKEPLEKFSVHVPVFPFKSTTDNTMFFGDEHILFVLVTLNVKLTEPSLWFTLVGTEFWTRLKQDVALTELTKKIARNNVAIDNIRFLFVIFCCNSVITLVYKFFYLLERYRIKIRLT